MGAAVRVGAAAKAPSWAPWHSSVEVAEVVRGVGNVGKSERQQRLLRGVPAVAIRRKAMYIVRGSVLRDLCIGSAGRAVSGFVIRVCMSLVSLSANAHFGHNLKLEISHREESGRRFAHYGTLPLPTGMPSSSTRPRTTPPCRTWARSKIDDDRRLRVPCARAFPTAARLLRPVAISPRSAINWAFGTPLPPLSPPLYHGVVV